MPSPASQEPKSSARPSPAGTVRDLPRSEHYLQAVLDTVIDAVITIDEHGIIVDANRAAERIFGYPRGELLGHNVSRLMPSPYRERHDDYLARYMQTGEAKIIGIGREVIARRRDGTTFPIDLAVSEIDHLRLFVGIIRDISDRKQLEREILQAAAEEQRRIGQDIHDGVGQELTGIGLFAQTLAETLEQERSPSAALAEKIVGSVQRVHQQVRTISHGLMPVSLEAGGLPSALQRLAEEITASSQAVCTFASQEPPPQFDLPAANHLYRIAQEAVANAVRHGQAGHIEISLSQGAQGRKLQIDDDGQGMPAKPAEETGIGLRSMHYRAHLIGGLLGIEPGPGGGTRVICLLPQDSQP